MKHINHKSIEDIEGDKMSNKTHKGNTPTDIVKTSDSEKCQPIIIRGSGHAFPFENLNNDGKYYTLRPCAINFSSFVK